MSDVATKHLPVLISTPHSSGFVPDDILSEMLGDRAHDEGLRERFLKRLFFEGDPYTDQIFRAEGALHFNAAASRFVVDYNRRRDEGGANGVIKLTDFSAEPLYPEDYRLSHEAAEARLETYWDPFHQAIEHALERDDVAFFVDGHAMAPVGPAIGPDSGKLRPALTLITGGDETGQPQHPGAYTSVNAEVAHLLIERLEHHFADVMKVCPNVPPRALLNSPFSMADIQRRYSNPVFAHHKPGFSLEVNRALYLHGCEDGFDEAIPEHIDMLNAAFNAFLEDSIPLFEKPRG